MKDYSKGFLENLHINKDTGLSSQEAKKRLAEDGPNAFQQTKPPSFLKLIWEQINSILIYILIGAAVISLVNEPSGSSFFDKLNIILFDKAFLIQKITYLCWD